MILSHHPKEDRSMKALAVVMVALVAVLTTVRACQVMDTKAGWVNPFAAKIADHHARMEAHLARNS